jgi:uncharacterized protein with von Willebrand factor type A (vWA) domain
VREKTEKLIERLESMRTFDRQFNLLYTDSINQLEALQDEVDRLAKHNQQLLQVIYQNQELLEG